MNRNINPDVIQFLNSTIQESLSCGDYKVAEIDKSLMDLYQRGFIDLYFDNGELMSKVTSAGNEYANINFAQSIPSSMIAEA
jgi:hypothetical protein